MIPNIWCSKNKTLETLERSVFAESLVGFSGGIGEKNKEEQIGREKSIFRALKLICMYCNSG